jgi:hypothetical protein
MKHWETLKQKAYRLWRKARLPRFFQKFGPKKTPAWKFYLCHLEYTRHSRCWRRAARFMEEFYGLALHWTTWQKAIAKWPYWVWHALGNTSAGDEPCAIAAVDGTGMSRTNASQHYIKRIDRKNPTNGWIQQVVLVDIPRRKFLAWRIRARPRGEKCDVPYLIQHSPVLIEGLLMDKGFDSNPLHEWLRNQGIWSVAPVRKGCKRGNYRRQLRDCFDWALYWQRSLVECLIGAVKRLFGAHVRAKTAKTQFAELSSRFIAYNIGARIFNDFLQSHQ